MAGVASHAGVICAKCKQAYEEHIYWRLRDREVRLCPTATFEPYRFSEERP